MDHVLEISSIYLGVRLKRRLKYVTLFALVAGGTAYGYQRYRKQIWFKQMEESEQLTGMKPRVVVLGTGKLFCDE